MNEKEMLRARVEVFAPCREESKSLTLEALQRGITLTPLIDAATTAAAYGDDAIRIVRDEYHPEIACQKGCWYCCCIPQILTSIPELFRILAYVRETYSPEELNALRERARDYTAKVNGRSLEELASEPAFPCPLLVDGCCSVYEARPLTCRGYNSLDVDECRRDYESPTYSVPLFPLVKDAADGTLTGEVEALKDAGSNAGLVDLGSALNVALSYGPGFEGAVIAGEPLLQNLEDNKWATDRRKGMKVYARAARMKF